MREYADDFKKAEVRSLWKKDGRKEKSSYNLVSGILSCLKAIQKMFI